MALSVALSLRATAPCWPPALRHGLPGLPRPLRPGVGTVRPSPQDRALPSLTLAHRASRRTPHLQKWRDELQRPWGRCGERALDLGPFS